MQEVWEAQAAIVGRSAGAAAEGSTDEQAAGPEDEASQAQHAYQAQLERLLAADVVLVPYGVLSQEVSLLAPHCILRQVSHVCDDVAHREEGCCSQDWPASAACVRLL